MLIGFVHYLRDSGGLHRVIPTTEPVAANTVSIGITAWDRHYHEDVDNPISIRQGFWAPYKKLCALVEEHRGQPRLAADAASSANYRAQRPWRRPIQSATNKPAEPKKVDVGVVAALACGWRDRPALASLATGLLKLAPWQIPLCS